MSTCVQVNSRDDGKHEFSGKSHINFHKFGVGFFPQRFDWLFDVWVYWNPANSLNDTDMNHKTNPPPPEKTQQQHNGNSTERSHLLQ